MRDENDQKELVLGNKQLLSIFFIVIAMLGVAFTLGYMIGRNTANVSAAGVSPGGAIQAPPVQNPTPREQAANAPSVPARQSAPDASTPAATPVEDKVTGTRPAKPYDTDGTRPPAVDAPAPAPVPVAATMPAGTLPPYLQVAAMKRADADHMVSVLRDRGFPALVGESSKEGLFRVLVGPYKDMPSLVDAKAKLKAAGFDNPIISR